MYTYEIYSQLARLRDILTAVLPGLAQNVVDAVVMKLEDIGVETMHDLDLVQDRDLVPPLKLIHARKFVNKCKEEGMTVFGIYVPCVFRMRWYMITTKYM